MKSIFECAKCRQFDILSLMENNQISKSRRKHPRFVPPQEAVCLVNRADGKVLVCKISDVSVGGIGLEYVSFMPRSTQPVSVDVFLAQRFRIKSIPCKLVYDRQLQTESGITSPWRRCGLEFQKITDPEQVRELNEFLINYCE